MATIAFTGIRGGLGVTSIVTGIAWALHQLGESVLVIDLSEQNLLRIHFNHDYTDLTGWGKSIITNSTGKKWYENAFEYVPRLTFLPFGFLSTSESLKLNNYLYHQRDWYKNFLDLSLDDYQWILFDAPNRNILYENNPLFRLNIDSEICLLNPDPACHTLLHNNLVLFNQLNDDSYFHPSVPYYFLINRFTANSEIQQDLVHLWQQTLSSLLPVVLHKDEAMAQALAHKKPVGEASPFSLIADELNTLAGWLLANCK